MIENASALPESQRLKFRCWRQDDFDLAWRLWGDLRVTARIGGPFSPDQVRDRLQAEIGLQRDLGVQYWPCFLHGDGAFVGCCGLRPHVESGTPELGFHLLPEFWGQGLAGEAARAVIELAFQRFRIPALFAGHHPENLASRRLLLALGFEPEAATLYPPTGLMHPGYRLTAAAVRPR